MIIHMFSSETPEWI